MATDTTNKTDKFDPSRYVSVNGGRALLRNFPGEERSQCWMILRRDGTWVSGMGCAAEMQFKGEFGYDDITWAEAKVLAQKLGSTLDAAYEALENLPATK